MTFNINEMTSALTGGGARPTLFNVDLTDTNGTLGLNLSKSRFMIHATTLPESNIGFFELPYFGRKIQYAGDRTYQPWRVSVFNDEDFAIRTSIETWIDKIQSTVSNIRTLDANTGYKGQAAVTQYGKKGNAIRTYQFYGLFPVSVDPITLDWGTTDSIESFDVTFKYDYFIASNPNPITLATVIGQ